jgi:hypothetical protein
VAPASATRQVGIRSGLRPDQKSFLDIGSIIVAGCLGSHLGGCRVTGFSLAAVTKYRCPGNRLAFPVIASVLRETSMLMISDANCETVIEEYIRTKGVTRCPTACVVPTQASVTAADRAALEEYRSERDRQRREKAAARARLFWGVDSSVG